MKHRLAWGVLALAAVCAHADAAVRVAIVGEDRPATSALISLVEAELANDQSLQILERAQIQKVLAEQKLSLAGAVESTQAVAAGKLLAVDVLAIVESDDAGPVGMVVFDAKTGVRLWDRALTRVAANVEKSAESITRAVREALEKRSHADQLRTVCLLTTRNVDLNASMDGFCDAVGRLIEQSLTASPDVTVLERSRLEQVNRERVLSPEAAKENKLWPSLVLVSIDFTAAATPDVVKATAVLTDLSGKELAKASASVTERNAAGLAQPLANQVMQALSLQPVADAPAAGQREAESLRFCHEARLQWNLRHLRECLRAGEAAYALDPDSTRAQTELASALAYYGTDLFMTGVTIDRKGVEAGIGSREYKYEQLDSSLTVLRRALDLIANTVARSSREGIAPQQNPTLLLTGNMISVYALQFRLAAVPLRPFVQPIGNLPKLTEPAQEQAVRDFVGALRKYYLDVEEPAFRGGVKDGTSFRGYCEYVHIMLLRARGSWAYSGTDWTTDTLELTTRWAKVRSQFGAEVNDWADRLALQSPLQIGVPELGWGMEMFERYWPVSAEDCARLERTLALLDASTTDAVRPYVQIRREWVIFAREHPPGTDRAKVIRDAQELEKRTQIAGPKINASTLPSSAPPTTQLSTPWTQSRILVDFWNEPDHRKVIKHAVVHKGFIYCVLAERVSRDVTKAEVVKISLADGSIKKIADTDGPTGWSHPTQLEHRSSGSRDIRAFIADGRYCFLESGVVLCNLDGSGLREIKKELGLPGKRLQAFTYLDGVLYAGLGSTLAAHDVQKNMFTVLASSVRAEKRSPFDNQPPLNIGHMVADAARRRIVFYAFGQDWPPELEGLWEYQIEKKAFRKLADMRFKMESDAQGLWSQTWEIWGNQPSDDKFILRVKDHAFVFDLASDRLSSLLTNPVQVRPPNALVDGWVWYPFGRAKPDNPRLETFPQLLPFSRPVIWPSCILPISTKEVLVGDAYALWVLTLK